MAESAQGEGGNMMSEVVASGDDGARMVRVFDRARRVIALAFREGCPPPSVELFPDGSARFRFPGRLCMALAPDPGAVSPDADAIAALIGSRRIAADPTDPDTVVILVGEALGREED